MWRAIFLAGGVMAMILGVEFLMIDSAVFYSGAQTKAIDFIDPTGAPSAFVNEWRPREWMPWFVLSVGAITVLYAFTLPRRFRSIAD